MGHLQLELSISLSRRGENLMVETERSPRRPRLEQADLNVEHEIGQRVLDSAAELHRVCHGRPGRGLARRRIDRPGKYARRIRLDEDQVGPLEFLPELANVGGVVQNDHLVGPIENGTLGLAFLARFLGRGRLREEAATDAVRKKQRSQSGDEPRVATQDASLFDVPYATEA